MIISSGKLLSDKQKKGLKIQHLLASHEWVEWTQIEERHLHIFNGALLLENIIHICTPQPFFPVNLHICLQLFLPTWLLAYVSICAKCVAVYPTTFYQCLPDVSFSNPNKGFEIIPRIRPRDICYKCLKKDNRQA